MVSTNSAMLSRVAVSYGNKQKDLVLPTELPIREYIGDVVDQLSHDQNIVAPTGGEWTLSHTGLPMKPEQPLHDAGVRDGAILELTAVLSTERYRPVIEDVIDAAARAAAEAGRPFDAAAARKAGLAALAVGGVGLCVAQWWMWTASHYSWWWVLAGALGAVAALVGTWSAATRYHAVDAASAWAIIWVASATVVGQLIPVSLRTGSPGIAHIMVAAGGVAVAAMCALLITGRHMALIGAVASLAASVSAVCAVAEYTGLQPSAIAAGVLLVGLVWSYNASNLASAIAQITLPKVPADGEEIEVEGELTGEELATVRARSERAVQLTTAFVVASSLTIALATVFTMAPSSYHHRIEVGIVVCVAIVLTHWGRTMSNALQANWMFSAVAIVIVGSAARMLLVWHSGWAPIVVVGVLAAAVGLLVVAAVVVTPRGVNPRVARAVEIVYMLSTITVFVLSAWVTGVFGVLRDLRIGG